MTINKLTDERLKELSAGYSSYIDESQAMAQELQEYRKGQAGMVVKPVLNMQFKNGWPVTGTAGVISGSPRIADGYHDFYFAPQPLTDSERAELQEYRKAGSQPVAWRWRWSDDEEGCWRYSEERKESRGSVTAQPLYNIQQPLTDAERQELQEYRKAAAEPVGEFYHEKAGWYQISEGDRVPDNRRIPLYAAPPAPVVLDNLFAAMEEVLRISDRDHEAWHRAKAEIESCRTAVPEALSGESQECRKAESADRAMLKRLAVILSGSDSSGEIGALTVTAQSFVDRCKQLAGELNQLRTTRLIVPAVTQSMVDEFRTGQSRGESLNASLLRVLILFCENHEQFQRNN
ncbi:hypothetical protein [Enterobacter mori]|uniref:hypothetical protein n=1 Tax=Enterobacter mori TaxID=539813 RepID=UPI003B83AACB